VTVTVPTDLARRVWLVAGVSALGVAGAFGLLRGPADAVGALVGTGLTLANFGGLSWAAARAVGRASTRSPLLWIGASGLRLALFGGLTGLLLIHTGIGVAGLVLSLALVPIAVVLAGLRAGRAA
jgi:hypothetical protein